MRGAVLAVRLGLAGVFAWAAFAKAMDPWLFAEGIEGFRFFPAKVVPLLALTVPWVELAAALLLTLTVERWQRRGALLALLLSSVFFFLFLWAVAWGLEIRCACFGALDFFGSTPLWGLMRSLLLLAASACLYLRK